MAFVTRTNGHVIADRIFITKIRKSIWFPFTLPPNQSPHRAVRPEKTTHRLVVVDMPHYPADRPGPYDTDGGPHNGSDGLHSAALALGSAHQGGTKNQAVHSGSPFSIAW